MGIHATDHSLKRAKERTGMNRKRAGRQVELAFERGLRSSDCSYSIDRKFLEHKSDRKKGVEAVAFNGVCYILDSINGRCITLFPLPNGFGKKKHVSLGI